MFASILKNELVSTLLLITSSIYRYPSPTFFSFFSYSLLFCLPTHLKSFTIKVVFLWEYSEEQKHLFLNHFTDKVEKNHTFLLCMCLADAKTQECYFITCIVLKVLNLENTLAGSFRSLKNSARSWYESSDANSAVRSYLSFFFLPFPKLLAVLSILGGIKWILVFWFASYFQVADKKKTTF